MLRALTDDGFIAFDDLMIYEIEITFGDRAIFPWDREFKGLKSKCFSGHNYEPALFVFCQSYDEVEYLYEFLKETGIRFCVYDYAELYDGTLSDCVIINLSRMSDSDREMARNFLPKHSA
jgi:hypothetical protein